MQILRRRTVSHRVPLASALLAFALLALGSWIAAVPGGEASASSTPAGPEPSAPPLQSATPGAWTESGSLITPRSHHAAALLADGRLLVVGGQGADSNAGPLTSAEVYSPTTGTWSVAGSLQTGRTEHRAVTLQNGKVLIVGGRWWSGPSSHQTLASAELFDPATGSWSATGSLAQARQGDFTATLLADGRVLVTGGVFSQSSQSSLASAEVYDPATGTWSSAGNLQARREGHAAARLSDGRVLVVGGTDVLNGTATNLSSAEAYDPTSNSWSRIADSRQARPNAHAFPLPDGTVLVISENPHGISPERYSPSTGTWTELSASWGVPSETRAVHLRNGRVLMAGGQALESLCNGYGTCFYSPVPTSGVWQYDPAADRLASAASLAKRLYWHTATPLADGRVIVVGGIEATIHASDPSLDRYERTGRTQVYLPEPALQLSVSADRATVEATELITVTGRITNTGPGATSAITLTLGEGVGTLYAVRSDSDTSKLLGRDGVTNTVSFDAGSLGPGQSAEFLMSLLIAPPLNAANPSQPVAATAWFTATSATAQSASASLTVTATEPSAVPVNDEVIDQLLGLPVADLGANPDAPLNAAAAQAGPVRAANDNFVFPSDYGDLWSYYVTRTIDRWPAKDKVLYYTLKKAGLSARSAYAAIYLKALIGARPQRVSLPDEAQLKKAAWLFWVGVQKAKWTGKEDGLKDAFKEAAKALDTMNATYLLNLLELHEGYSQPLVDALSDKLATYALTDYQMQLELIDYVEGTVASLRTTPYPRLVEADVNHWLRTGRFHTRLHAVLKLANIRNRQDGTRSLGSAVEEVMHCSSTDLPCTPGWPVRRKWLAIHVHSPLLPVVTDSQGRKAGADPATGALYTEIPGAQIEPGHPWTLAVPAASEQLGVQYATAYPYEFGVDLLGHSGGNLTSMQSFTGTATADYTARQTIAVAPGADAVTLTATRLVASAGGYRTGLPVTFVQLASGW